MPNIQADDPQPSTTANDFDNLEIWEQKCILLRVDGYTPLHISGALLLEKISLSARSISHYFSRNGKWYKIFQDQKKIRGRENRVNEAEMQKLFRGAAREAFLTVRKAMRGDNLAAALQILDRSGFQVVQKTEDVGDTQKINKIAKYIDELSNNKPS